MNRNHIIASVAVVLMAIGAALYIQPTAEKAITIESPTSSEDITIFYTADKIVVTEVADVVIGTTPSVTWNIDYASSRNSVSPTSLWTSDRTTTSETGTTTTTFNNDTIDGSSWIWLTSSAQSGTVTEMNVTLSYKKVGGAIR